MIVKLLNLTTGVRQYVMVTYSEWRTFTASCGAEESARELCAWHANSPEVKAAFWGLWDRGDEGPRISRTIYYTGSRQGGTHVDS